MADAIDLSLSLPLPRLRAVEAFPVEVEGAPMICLRDPEGVAAETVVLSPPAFLIASLLDGAAGIGAIRSRAAGVVEGLEVSGDDIRSLVAELDKRGFLDTPGYRLQRAEARRKFAELPVRPSSHAGASYPEDPAELRALIRSCFSADNGPGWPFDGSQGPERAEGLEVSRPARAAPAGLVAPHVDFARGGPVYAFAHRRLAECALPELVIVLGVAHAGTAAPFTLTRKTFETPLGTVEADLDAVRALEEACGDVLFEDEFIHRDEHSIEFQLPWIQTVHPGRPFRIVPVLCSAFEQYSGKKPPESDPRVSGPLRALRTLVAERKALVIASVDLSHVGPRFGDDVEVDEALAAGVQAGDEKLLAHARSGDREAFWAAGMADGNARRVDALSAVYALLAATDGRPGSVLAYGQGHDPAGGLVSFAAMSFE